MAAAFPKFRTLLVLGRISNLPTVWSNCLAAWLLNGGGAWTNFYILNIAATMLYVGGMFLNDAFDAGFDRQFRQERPIPSGQITERMVWWIGGSLLLAGGLLLLLIGTTAALCGLLLVAAIVLYDAVHKQTVFAPLLMAACRFLLYLVAAAATLRQINQIVIYHALALTAYIAGLSYFARNESRVGLVQRWPVLLLAAPFVMNVLVNLQRNLAAWMLAAALLIWLLWCLRGLFGSSKPNLGRTVASLLAGIVLVDGATLAQPAWETALLFAGLFILALVMQRKIPAT